MSDLHPRPREECAFDAAVLGEVMLRLDSSEGHIRTARTFRVWEGGREYNVARGLRRCFGLRTAIVTALADNEVGRLVEDLMLQGVRPRPLGDLAAAPRRRRLRPRLRRLGVRWFHTGGIFAALSESTAEVAEEAMAAARRHGTIVSYDLNYRPSLWQSIGGMARAREVNRRLVFQVDMLLGNEEDFTACLGYEVPGADLHAGSLEAGGFRAMIGEVVDELSHLRVVATTLRGVRSATINDWSAIAWPRDTGFVEAAPRHELEILDRVGGGDSFASGLVYGLLENGELQRAVNYGAAHGALAMTTPGDTSMATLAEVERLVAGASARVVR